MLGLSRIEINVSTKTLHATAVTLQHHQITESAGVILVADEVLDLDSVIQQTSNQVISLFLPSSTSSSIPPSPLMLTAIHNQIELQNAQKQEQLNQQRKRESEEEKQAYENKLQAKEKEKARLEQQLKTKAEQLATVRQNNQKIKKELEDEKAMSAGLMDAKKTTEQKEPPKHTTATKSKKTKSTSDQQQEQKLASLRSAYDASKQQLHEAEQRRKETEAKLQEAECAVKKLRDEAEARLRENERAAKKQKDEADSLRLIAADAEKEAQKEKDNTESIRLATTRLAEKTAKELKEKLERQQQETAQNQRELEQLIRDAEEQQALALVAEQKQADELARQNEETKTLLAEKQQIEAELKKQKQSNQELSEKYRKTEETLRTHQDAIPQLVTHTNPLLLVGDTQCGGNGDPVTTTSNFKAFSNPSLGEEESEKEKEKEKPTSHFRALFTAVKIALPFVIPAVWAGWMLEKITWVKDPNDSLVDKEPQVLPQNCSLFETHPLYELCLYAEAEEAVNFDRILNLLRHIHTDNPETLNYPLFQWHTKEAIYNSQALSKKLTKAGQTTTLDTHALYISFTKQKNFYTLPIKRQWIIIAFLLETVNPAAMTQWVNNNNLPILFGIIAFIQGIDRKHTGLLQKIGISDEATLLKKLVAAVIRAKTVLS